MARRKHAGWPANVPLLYVGPIPNWWLSAELILGFEIAETCLRRRSFGACTELSVITQFDGLMITFRDGPARKKFPFDRSRRKVAAGARPWVES